MAIIRPLNGIVPKIGKNCFIAENAAIIGDVEIGDDCSIWYGALCCIPYIESPWWR